jgi:DNA polymerase III subunit delta'
MSGFEILPWHQQAWARVGEQRAADRLPHAYLISGLQGSGRLQFAKAVAVWLLCEQPTHEACGKCAQCLLFDGGNHPDVLELVPEENSKVIKIEQIRRATQFISQTTNQLGATKLIILRPAEALRGAAANALLKNLEEPPGKTLFLLISEPTSQLLSTIRSRCQPLPLQAADKAQSLTWLQQHSAASLADLRAAEALAPGRPLEALNLLEQGIPVWCELLQEKLSGFEQGSDSITELAQFCGSQPPLYAIELLQRRAADRVRSLFGSVPGIGDEAVRLSVRKLLEFQRELCRVNAQLASGANPNPQLTLEHLFLAWRACS